MDGYHEQDIAIVGMACRTAGANTPSELWDILHKSQDVQREITRFNVSAYHNADRGFKRGHTNVKRAYLMGDDLIERFDHAFFHITPNEARCMDPQQRFLLEAAYEAVENAGMPFDTIQGTDTAVFAAAEGCDYAAVLGRDFANIPRYASTGIAGCMAANRISYFFNLSGPSMVVDTACSSSMTALQQAIRALNHGDSGMAIVCAAKMILNPDMFIPASEMGFLSPDGRCKSFDKSADGYGRGEGVISMLLKPLSTAIADGNPIRAVIKGVRVNHDGRTQGITMPSAEAQEDNIRKLYLSRDIHPDSIQYVEAHGTGTVVGDMQELSAIDAVFNGPQTKRTRPLLVGSVKSNIGHLEAAAGLAGILKTVLSLEHGCIPAQMQLRKLNPAIPFQKVDFPTVNTEWPVYVVGKRRAAVNCFGAGGTNGHCVLEEYPRKCPSKDKEDKPYLFLVSASTQFALKAACKTFSEYVKTQRPAIRELAVTLGKRRRQAYAHLFSATNVNNFLDQIQEAEPLVTKIDVKDVSNICWIFTGQGAQWPAMGAELMRHSSIFRDTVINCEQYLLHLPNAPPWKLSEELCKDPSRSNMSRASFAQPLVTVLQLGLVDLWRSWGFQPTVVLGHSSGEIAAAYACGSLSLRDAVVISYLRGIAVSQLKTKREGSSTGAMAAVGVPEEEALQIMKEFIDKVQMAAMNSPQSCTLSGDQDAIESIGEYCNANDIFFRQLRIDIAYHSRHVLPVANLYLTSLEEAGIKPLQGRPKCSMFSSVTGQLLKFSDYTPQYWTDNMTSKVRFSDALQSCAKENPYLSLCLEIGPHPALRGPVLETLQSLTQPITYLSSCVRDEDGFLSQINTAEQILRKGIDLNIDTINDAKDGNLLTDLPPILWDHSLRLWCESSQSKNIRYKRFSHHPLLGSRYTEDTNSNPSWRGRIEIDELPWKLRNGDCLPDAAYILMALEAARQIRDQEPTPFNTVSLEKLMFRDPLKFDDTQDKPTLELHFTSFKSLESNKFAFNIFTADITGICSSTYHCSGALILQLCDIDQPQTHPQHDHDLFMLESARDLGLLSDNRLEDIRITSGAATACDHTGNNIDPLALYDVLQLGLATVSALGTNATPKLESIGNICFDLDEKITRPIRAYVRSTNTDSRINLSFTIGRCLYANEISYKMVESDFCSLPLSSLFYKPVTEVDITSLPSGTRFSLVNLIHLVTHKWPMCDLGLAELEIEDERRISEILRSFGRRRFGSLQTTGSTQESTRDSIRKVDQFTASHKFHLLLTGSKSSAEEHLDRIQGIGVVVFNATENSGDENWELIKPLKVPNIMSPTYDTVILAPSEMCKQLNMSDTQQVDLREDAILRFVQDQHKSFHMLVLDEPNKSINIEWRGEALLPLLQSILKFVRTVTWLTRKSTSRPAINSTSALMRTIASEKPSIGVRHIILQKNASLDLRDYINTNSANDDNSFSELVQEVEETQRMIVRWLPDDELSARMGTLPYFKHEIHKEQQPNLLPADGTIIVIGGLGGLGRYVCKWLIKHHAKHVTVISRSGSDSAQGMLLRKEMEEMRGCVTITRCDACDKIALSAALESIRKNHQIKGVINMAMLLGDAPLASMTAEQWDRPLRLKVKSSWNLHELTLTDDLDIFILFSSIASVLGNRNQAGYNVGNAYVNSLAEFRRAQHLPAVAIALGAMTDMGVLHETGSEGMLAALTRSGLTHLQEHHLDRIMRAAVVECTDPNSSRAVILTGLRMFERIDGKLVGKQDQTMLYWTEMPEFGHLQYHKRTWQTANDELQDSLLIRLKILPEKEAQKLLEDAFFSFLSGILGFEFAHLDAERKLMDYGLDSLSGVTCQYWFHRGQSLKHNPRIIP